MNSSEKVRDDTAAPGNGCAPISAVLAVRDEASQLREALEQLSFCAEIVVVDMGSVDGSLEIARELADKCISHDGGPHALIHVNKNVGIDAASHEWVLNLDADERLTPELRAEIIEVVADPDPEVVAYGLPFTHYFFGRYLRYGGFRGPLVRLFRRDRFRYGEERAHSAPAIDGRTEVLKNLVVHFNHPTIASFVEKMNRYTSSDAPLAIEHGRGGLRNRPVPQRFGWALATAPFRVFWNRYVRHQGFRDGAHGFVAAVLMGAYQFVEHGKMWECLHASSGGAAKTEADRDD